MKITVVGTGYVGLVVGACLAETGNDVVCADVDTRKIGMLLANLATLTGRDTAAYVSVHSGLRARLARDTRRLS